MTRYLIAAALLAGAWLACVMPLWILLGFFAGALLGFLGGATWAVCCISVEPAIDFDEGVR